jgi:hypothetical protein
MNCVFIPPLILKKQPENYTECDCGGRSPIFETKLIGPLDKLFYRFENLNTIHFYNDKKYFLQPNSCKTIAFPVTILTSLPAESLLTCNSWIYTKNITTMINAIPTNDSYVYVTIFNYSTDIIEINPFDLQVTCKIIVTGKNSNIISSQL